MKNISKLVPTLAAAFALLSLGAQASAQPPMSMPAASSPDVKGHGAFNEFGKTDNFDAGILTEDEYTHAWYCDTSVPAMSVSGCEVGTTFTKPPSSQYDPLYITVPLGFTVPPMAMQCPQGLVCVDHPATIDLSAIGGPANSNTPGHDHFTTTRFGGNPEWWNVLVVGVMNRATYDAIASHGSYAYIQRLIKMGDKNVTKPIPTNLFLYFAVKPLPHQ